MLYRRNRVYCICFRIKRECFPTYLGTWTGIRLCRAWLEGQDRRRVERQVLRVGRRKGRCRRQASVSGQMEQEHAGTPGSKTRTRKPSTKAAEADAGTVGRKKRARTSGGEVGGSLSTSVSIEKRSEPYEATRQRMLALACSTAQRTGSQTAKDHPGTGLAQVDDAHSNTSSSSRSNRLAGGRQTVDVVAVPQSNTGLVSRLDSCESADTAARTNTAAQDERARATEEPQSARNAPGDPLASETLQSALMRRGTPHIDGELSNAGRSAVSGARNVQDGSSHDTSGAHADITRTETEPHGNVDAMEPRPSQLRRSRGSVCDMSTRNLFRTGLLPLCSGTSPYYFENARKTWDAGSESGSSVVPPLETFELLCALKAGGTSLCSSSENFMDMHSDLDKAKGVLRELRFTLRAVLQIMVRRARSAMHEMFHHTFQIDPGTGRSGAVDMVKQVFGYPAIAKAFELHKVRSLFSSHDQIVMKWRKKLVKVIVHGILALCVSKPSNPFWPRSRTTHGRLQAHAPTPLQAYAATTATEASPYGLSREAIRCLMRYEIICMEILRTVACALQSDTGSRSAEVECDGEEYIRVHDTPMPAQRTIEWPWDTPIEWSAFANTTCEIPIGHEKVVMQLEQIRMKLQVLDRGTAQKNMDLMKTLEEMNGQMSDSSLSSRTRLSLDPDNETTIKSGLATVVDARLLDD
ncbi:hypothetical protein FVE85_2719 [Porphyridium purpureum]|uniref:Uncharacterized protein n=1 Tax=Porphyridium purpureum TaxID=35688 RepID=A0A5J4YTG7_PORPP|nr:hypothetical protein FVE85_2719 [Porphyridium purpureum]|eukprot:POR2833..scf227_4